MNIIKTQDYEQMSLTTAGILVDLITQKPDCVLGLASGSTPIGTYHKLIEWYQNGKVDFSGVTTINLDEYKGLSPENPQSYRYYMNMQLFNHINIDKSRTYLPNGLESNAEKACREYDQIVRQCGGIDLQLLGLGNNGHIGFNEPGSSFEWQTHCVALAKSTIDANARFFDSPDKVPKEAYTMGIKTIMQARKIVVIVNGRQKADIVQKAFFGPVTPDVPASVLQLHNDVTVVGDEEALP